MNTDKHQPNPLEIRFDEAQWQAQERARQAVREGNADADEAELRIARALRAAPPVDLPADFAAQMAALVQEQAAVASRFEQNLLRVLTAVFGLSAAATVAYYGHGWAAAATQALPGGANTLAWVTLAALCIAGNWGWGLLRSLRVAHRHA